MKLTHTTECRLVMPSLCLCYGGVTRACKGVRSTQSSYELLRKQSRVQSRVQGRRSSTQHRNTVTLATAAAEDVIDVEADVIDDRIPVTVRHSLDASHKVAVLDAMNS